MGGEEQTPAVGALAVETGDMSLHATTGDNGNEAAADDRAEHGAASPEGEENLSAKDSGSSGGGDGGGGVSPTAARTKMVGPTDFKAMKADRASRIAARTSAMSSDGSGGGGGDKKRVSVAADGEAAPSPPLSEATNTSKVAPRSKIPTVRRTSRRTRGAV